MDISHKNLKISQAAKFLGVSIDTLRRWEAAGKITPLRTPGNTRLYPLAQLEQIRFNLQKQMLTVSQAAASLGVSVKTLQRWDEAGKLRSLRNNKGYRVYSQKQLDDLKSGKIQADPQEFTHTRDNSYIPSSMQGYIKPLHTLPKPSLTETTPVVKELTIPSQLIKILGVTIAIFGLSLAGLTAGFLFQPKALQQLASGKSSNPVANLVKSALSSLTNTASTLAEDINPKLNLTKAQAIKPDQVLAAATNPGLLQINTNTEVNGDLSVNGNLVGVVRTIKPGTNLSVDNTDPASPTLSVVLPANLVTTIGKKSGDISLGSGLAISDGGKLSVNSTLDNIRANGGCSGCLTDSDVADNLTISSGGSVDVGALSGTVPISKGGTGLTSVTAGDILYASAANTLKSLPVGTSGQILSVSAGIPAWSSLSSSAVTSLNSLTGALTIAGGGINSVSASGSTITVTATEADTLSSVTGRGASTSTALILSNASPLTLSSFTSSGLLHNNTLGVISSSLVTNADVAATAAITYSKLSLTGSLVNTDISNTAAIAYSKLNLASSILASDLSSTTGSGAVVLASSPTITTPTFTTSATTPLVIGGTSTTSTLSLRSTSGVGTTGADIIFQTGNNGATEAMRILNSGSVGIGTNNPSSLFSVGSTSQFQVNSSGAIAALTGITSSGGYTQSGAGANTFTGATTANSFSSSGVTITGGTISGTTINNSSVGATTPSTGAFTTLTSSGASTLGTGASLTNTFGSGASSANTIGSTTTPGTLTLHGATTLDNTFTVSGSNLTSLGGNLTVTGTAWTATPTISGLITATSGLTSNGTLTVAANQNLTLNSGTGVYSQTFSGTTQTPFSLTSTFSPTAGGTQNNINTSVTNTAATSTNTLRGLNLSLTDNSTALANTDIGINVDVSAGTNASATRYAAILNGGNVGIGTTSPSYPLVVEKDGISTTPTTGSQLQNATAATAGAPNQYSPSLQFTGQSWNTGSLANNQFDARQYLSVSSANPPTAKLNWGFQRAGGGYTDYMNLDNSGNLTITGNLVANGGSAGFWSRSGTTITPATAGDLLSLPENSTDTTGNLFNISYASPATLTGALVGVNVDLNNGQVTNSNNNVTGVNVKLPTVTDSNTTGTVNIKGLSFGFGTGAGINQTGAGATVYTGVDVSVPAITQTSGTITGNGVNITTSSQLTGSATSNGLNISASGVGAGSLNAVNISGITGSTGTETALNIGSGWDNVLTVNGTSVLNGSGVAQVAAGGTNLTSYTAGDLIYASGTTTLSKLAGGTPNNGKVLTVSSGLPVWGTIAGSSCTDCVVNDPTAAATNTITPSTNIQSLIVRQTTAVTPTADIFQVTDKTGGTKYFYVDSSGNVSTGGVASQTLTLTPASDTTALTLVGTNVSTQALQYINSKNASAVSGIVNLAYGVAQTLTGAVTGVREDLSTNVTATNQNVTGYSVTLPTMTNTITAGTIAYKGLSVVAGGGITQNGTGGTTTFTGVDVTLPTLTQSLGTVTGNGINISTPATPLITGGTVNGLNVAATGVSVGTLNGINISSITAGAGTQTAVNIGSGWTTPINSASTGLSTLSGSLQLGPALGAGSGVLIVNGGIDLGGANRSIRNANNNSLSFGTNNTDRITINADGTATTNFASSTTALNINSGILDIDTTNSRVGIGTASPGAPLDISKSFTTNGAAAVKIAGTLTAASNTDTGYGLNIAPAWANSSGTNTNTWYGLNIAPTASNAWTSNYGAYITMPNSASTNITEALHLTPATGGSPNADRGLVVEMPSGATHNSGITIGTVSTSSGTWSLYNASTANSYFAGNVGIGTTGPDAKLQIVQSGASTMGLHLQQSGSVINNNDNAAFYVQDQQTNGTAFRVRNDSATTATFFSHIDVNNTSANTVALRVDNTGLGDTLQIAPSDPKVNNDGGNLKTAKIINVASTDHSYLTLDNRDLTVGGHKNQITISNVNKVFVYDTTKDADGGRWTNDERAQGSSWYNESRTAADACVVGTNTRCGAQAFPKKAIIVATNASVHIFDAKDNSLWMTFNGDAGNSNILLSTGSNNVSIYAFNGKLYVVKNNGAGSGLGFFVINFLTDTAFNSQTTGYTQYKGTVANRNAGSGYSSSLSASYVPISNATNDLAVQVINGKTYVAVATAGGTNGGVSLFDETDLTVANFGVASKAYQSVKLSPDNSLYGLNSTDSELDVWYLASTKSGNNVATSVTYTSSSTPALWSSAPTINSSAPDQLFVTQGTSTSDGKSNTIYVAHNAGLSVIQENQGTQASGTVKYYTTNSISEEMVGDIRGMWPFAGSSTLTVNTTLPAADNDVSLKASNLTTTANVPTHVSGVRGNGLSFNGTNSLICSGTAGTCSTNANLGITGDMTYGTWFKSGTTAQATPIVWKPNGYTLLYSNYSTIGTLNKYTCAWYDSVGATWRTVTSNQSTSTNWTQIACGMSGTTMSIYINGLLDNTATYSGTRSAGTIFYLAGDNSASYFNGSLDEPYVSATVLTASEINHIYQVAYRALQNHASKTIRGTTIGADGSQVLGGFTNVTKAVAIDQEKGQIYVGTSAGNGAVSIIGIDSDTLNDLYSTSGTYSGMSITDEVAGSYSGAANVTYNNTLSLSKGYGTGVLIALGSNNAGSGGIWLESNDTTLKDFLATSYNPFGSNLTQSNVNVDSVFRVVNQLSSRIDNLALGSGSSGGTQPYLAEAFKVDTNGNLLSRSLFNSTTAMQFEDASGTTLLNLDTTNDRVGIGTTSPGDKLEIAQSSAGSFAQVLRLANSDATSQASSVGLDFVNGNVGLTTPLAKIKGYVGATGNNGGGLDFQLRNGNDGSYSSVLTLSTANSNTGNVGIGTTSPGQALTVVGNTTTSGYLTVGSPASTAGISSGDIYIPYGNSIAAANSAGNNTYRLLKFGTNGGNTNQIILGPDSNTTVSIGAPGSTTGAGNADLVLQNNHAIRFANAAGTNADSVINYDSSNNLNLGTSNSTRLTILSGGSVGIGTTSPRTSLSVGGTVTDTGTDAFGMDFAPKFPTTATAHMRGIVIEPSSTAGTYTTTNEYGLWIEGFSKGAGHTITNSYGEYIQTQSAGTNNYGLFVNGASGGTNNYSAIFMNGNVGIGTTTPGEKLEVSGNIKLSGVIKGSDIGARVYNSANISLTNNVDTALTFDSERYNTDTIHSTVTNTGRLTANTAGKYVITGHARFGGSSVGLRLLSIRVNGVTKIAISQIQADSGGNNLDTSVATVYNLNATDYVELLAFQNSGGALNVLNVGNVSPEFAMQRIAGADVAEYYPTNDKTISEGDIVAIDPSQGENIVKANKPYQTTMGVISTNPAVILGNTPDKENSRLVGLAGKVPIKVSTANGVIKLGSLISASSLSGIGMRTTSIGNTVAQAMDDFNPSNLTCQNVASLDSISWPENAGLAGNIPCFQLPDGTYVGMILGFIQNSLADPSSVLANLTLDETGSLMIPSLKIKTLSALPNTSLGVQEATGSGTLAYHYIDVGQKLSDQTNQLSALQDQTATNSAQLADLSSQVAGVATQSAEISNKLQLTSDKLASSSAEIASNSAKLADLDSRILTLDSKLTTPEVMLATQSANLKTLTVAEDATFSAKLSAYDLSISNSLKSLGTTSLGDTTIAGNLSVDGTLSLTGSSINTLSSTLYLQNNPLASLVDLFNGLVTIDKTGLVKAQAIVAKQFNVSSGQSAGTATLPAGQTEVTIANSYAKTNSIIVLTPETLISTPLVISSKVDGSFKVKLSAPNSSDINFSYLIIGQQ